jgi:hypothetical protein
VSLDDAAGDAQPEPGAAVLAGRAGGLTTEGHVENAR